MASVVVVRASVLSSNAAAAFAATLGRCSLVMVLRRRFPPDRAAHRARGLIILKGTRYPSPPSRHQPIEELFVRAKTRPKFWQS